MKAMHSLLKRQLKKAFGDNFSVPGQWEGFIEMVNKAYREFDTDRGMLERSLELSSQELFEANSEMRAIFEAIPDLLFRVDRDGFILDCKTGNTSDLLVTREKLIGRKIYEIPVAAIGKRFKEAIKKVEGAGSFVNIEYSLDLDGTEQFYEARFLPFVNGQTMIIVRNVTQKHSAEVALRKSEEKYRSIFENSIEGIFQTTREGGYVDVNPALARMFGYDSPEEMLRTLTDVGQQHYIVPEDRMRFRELIEKHEVLQGFETQVRRKDGAAIWISINARVVRDKKGEIAFYEGTIENITDRKRAEEALFESEEKYRSIIEESHVGVYIIQDNVFTFVNPMFCTIHGYTYDEIVGKMGPGDFVLPEDFAVVKDSIKKRFASEIKTAELNYRIRRKDGEVRIIKAIGSSILYKRRLAIIGTILDLSKEKVLEEQLLQSQKLETVGRLAGGIAHDFNNMLGVILGNVQLAKISLSPDERAYEFCQSIEKATSRAAGFVKQLLAFSRRQLLELKVCDLNHLLGNFESMVQRVIGENIEMSIVPAPGLPAIKADETQINQVLLNLVVNARDAMPDGGILTVSTGTTDIDNKYIQMHPDVSPGSYVVLSVSDTGIGMEKNVTEKMFEPFFTTKAGGSGLGLSVVYGIIKQHGGFVDVISEYGRGTTFRVYLPRAEEAAAGTIEKPAAVHTGSETILVVEDDDDFRRVEAELLKKLGYRVYTASDGIEGINMFKEKQEEIDLVILDVVMPRMSGRETLEEMQKVRPGISSLFVTGYSLDGIHVNYILEQGIDAIQKPFSFETLSRKIREVIEKRKNNR